MAITDVIQFAIAGTALFLSVLSLLANFYYQSRFLRIQTRDVSLRDKRVLECQLRQIAQTMLDTSDLLRKSILRLEERKTLENRAFAEDEIKPISNAAFGLKIAMDFLEKPLESPTADAFRIANWTLSLLNSYEYTTNQLDKIGILHMMDHDPIATLQVQTDLESLAIKHNIELRDIGDPSVIAALGSYRREDYRHPGEDVCGGDSSPAE